MMQLTADAGSFVTVVVAGKLLFTLRAGLRFACWKDLQACQSEQTLVHHGLGGAAGQTA